MGDGIPRSKVIRAAEALGINYDEVSSIWIGTSRVTVTYADYSTEPPVNDNVRFPIVDIGPDDEVHAVWDAVAKLRADVNYLLSRDEAGPSDECHDDLEPEQYCAECGVYNAGEEE